MSIWFFNSLSSTFCFLATRTRTTSLSHFVIPLCLHCTPMQLESNYNTKKFPKNSSRIWAKKTASSTGNKITLIYFTRTLPALLQILVVTFAVTSGKVPNVRRILSQTRQTHKTMPTSPLPPQQQPSHYVAQHFRCRSSHSDVVLDHYPYCRRCNTTVDYCTVSRQQQHVMCRQCWAYHRHLRFCRCLLQPSTATSATSPACESTTEKLELDGSFVWGDETALHICAAMRSGSHYYLDLDTYDDKATRL